MNKLSHFINVANGKHNTQDCVENGSYPFFDRSEIVKRSNKFIFDIDAIIIPGEGTSFIPRYYKGKFDLHQRCYCITTKSEGLNLKYLYYFLLSNQDYFKRVATGSTVKSLRLIHFIDMPVKLHSIDKQRYIVDTILHHFFF